jgi:ribosomal protein L16/L10AE
MLLHPKKTKFKSEFGRKRMKCITNPILRSSLKCFGIISYETGKINNKQIEALRKIMKRSLKSYGKF